MKIQKMALMFSFWGQRKKVFCYVQKTLIQAREWRDREVEENQYTLIYTTTG